MHGIDLIRNLSVPNPAPTNRLMHFVSLLYCRRSEREVVVLSRIGYCPSSLHCTVLLLPELYLSYIELHDCTQKISQDRKCLLFQLWEYFCVLLHTTSFVHNLGIFEIKLNLMTTRVKARERLCSTVCPEAILQREKYKQTERGGTKLGIDTLES